MGRDTLEAVAVTTLDRRALLHGVALGGGLAPIANLFPKWAQAASMGLARAPEVLSGAVINLDIGHAHWTVDGKTGHAAAVNGTVPGPLIRLKEGQDVRLTVKNDLSETTSLHWHGVLVPAKFDGVPGISFPGIAPGETFDYTFPVRQAGTYWYHSHSGLQEQEGVYGPIVIDPSGPDPIGYDREHVVVLSDFSFVHPHQIFENLKKQPGLFNYQKETLHGLLTHKDQPLQERTEWGGMRMDPTDISDVTGAVYTYLVNGRGPDDNWTALFAPGERVRLRFINASSMTIFNVRIPGLAMSVVQADGQNVRPVVVDEFQISVAETFDVLISPSDGQAYTLVAEAVDRSGMARATIAPREGMAAPTPPLRSRPIATMRDMGMDMATSTGGGGMAEMDMGAASKSAASMDMNMRNPAHAPTVKMGPGVQMIAPMAVDRTGDPGQGLENVGHKVLVYRDLVALEPNPDPRPPSRSLQIHLTGNMERYMWSFDGEGYSEVAAPIPFRRNERVRVTLVNDSMMSHPIHIHGHFFDVVTGPPGFQPRKHTINVLPGGSATFDLTADAPGDWAFHCHLLYHMHAGMFRVVSVRPLDGASA